MTRQFMVMSWLTMDAKQVKMTLNDPLEHRLNPRSRPRHIRTGLKKWELFGIFARFFVLVLLGLGGGHLSPIFCHLRLLVVQLAPLLVPPSRIVWPTSSKF